MEILWRVNSRSRFCITRQATPGYNTRAMSERSPNAPTLTADEIKQLRESNPSAKRFGHVPNKSEAASRAKWEARKAAKASKTNQ